MRRRFRKRIGGETKLLLIPTYSRADVGHQESRNRTNKFVRRGSFFLDRKSDRAVTSAFRTFVKRWFYFLAFRQIHGDRANNTLQCDFPMTNVTEVLNSNEQDPAG